MNDIKPYTQDYQGQNIMYKGLKCVIIWVIVYLILRMTLTHDMCVIDMYLVATTLTLLFFVIDNMLYYPKKQEGMDNIQVVASGKIPSGPEFSVSSDMSSRLVSDASSVLSSMSGSGSVSGSGSSVNSGMSNSQMPLVQPTQPVQPVQPTQLSQPTVVMPVQPAQPAIITQTESPLMSEENPVITKDYTIGIREEENQINKPEQEEGKLQWYEQSFDPRKYSGAENLDQIAIAGGRTRNDMLVNNMIYSDFNRLPPSFNDKDFEYGYSFLPPKDWYPLPPYPPVCVSHSSVPVKPVYLDTTTMDLKEWHETQKITPPDSINTSYVINELNSKV